MQLIRYCNSAKSGFDAHLARPSGILGGLPPLRRSQVVENGGTLPLMKVRLCRPAMKVSRTVVLVTVAAVNIVQSVQEDHELDSVD